EASKRSGLQLTRTDDKALFQAFRGDAGFFFDTLDPRFWVVHTMSNIEAAEPVLQQIIDENPNIDYAWPPSGMMRNLKRRGRPLGFAVDFDGTVFLSPSDHEPSTESNEIVKIRLGGTGADRWLRQLEKFEPSVLAFSMVKFSREDHTTTSRIVQELN